MFYSEKYLLTLLLYYAYHAVSYDHVMVCVTLLKFLGYDTGFILIALHLHYCVVKVRIKFLSDCLDWFHTDVLKFCHQLFVDAVHTVYKRILFGFLGNRCQTSFKIIYYRMMMNQNFKLIKASCISKGGITETATDIRLIIKEAVLNNATIIAFCHNHPSNNPQPSKADDVLTQKIAKACEIMRLFFMDHVIITDGAFYSYHDKGKL